MTVAKQKEKNPPYDGVRLYPSAKFVCLFMFFNSRVGPVIGLFIIGVGTGGIKTCVNPFCGEQFASDQVAMIFLLKIHTYIQ